MPVDDIKNRLLGNHVKIHNLDFEVMENDQMLRIIPHAEQVTNIKTLPITSVKLDGDGNNTQVVISSKMREIDSGGPILIVVFCSCMLIGAALFYIFGSKEFTTIMYTLLTISVLLFSVFWMRMQAGYFDYVRKIRAFIKTQSAV
ncbi:MAG: hypothetical protein H0X33_09850 [Taibaiella sp.]|nr:hypothetical protein [Taibaiella sp.]